MLELFADWEPLPSVASIRAASRVTEPTSATVQVVELGTACSQQQQQEPSDKLAPSDTAAAKSTGQLLTPAAAAPLAQGVRQLVPPSAPLTATGSQSKLKQQCSERDDRAAIVEQLTSPSGAVTHAIIEPEVPDKKQQPDELVSSQPTPEQGSASEEEGELPEDGELAEPETKKKRQRGERAGKRVRQRIAKRAREREHQQLQLEAGLSPQLVTPNKAHRKEKPTCKYYLFGKCSKGDACPFPHAGQPVTKLISCRFFNQGTCQRGDACPYSHDNTVEPCKQLVLHGVCRFGPNCHFSHEPLPAYAVAPLQEWFKEQDQLKQDRSARATDEAMHMDHEASQSPGDVAPTASQQDATNSGDDTSAAADDCGAPLKYSSWTDPWRLLYGTRLHNLGKRSAEPKAQSVTDNAAEFEPLSGPYSSWQDGWNRLFARDSVKQSQTALPVL